MQVCTCVLGFYSEVFSDSFCLVLNLTYDLFKIFFIPKKQSTVY